VQAILWDNDGVLVDTEELYYRATREALAELGVELGVADFVELSLRRGQSCFDLALERGDDPERIDATRFRRNARYEELLGAGVPLIDGVAEALRALRGLARMAVVTSTRPEHFALVHARTGIRDAFELVLTKGDYARSKPDPEPYLVAAARLGVTPADCLVVEDSERGLAAATRAGMRCVVIPRGLTAGGDFASAYRVLTAIDELPPIARAQELAGSSSRVTRSRRCTGSVFARRRRFSISTPSENAIAK
jgi:HAD superfamily hydrolase (TIGR01509 family)